MVSRPCFRDREYSNSSFVDYFKGLTALTFAVAIKAPEYIVACLAKDDLLTKRDMYGHSPLCCAILIGSVDHVRWLLKADTECWTLSIRDGGNRLPLALATKQGKAAIVKAIIAKGDDLVYSSNPAFARAELIKGIEEATSELARCWLDLPELVREEISHALNDEQYEGYLFEAVFKTGIAHIKERGDYSLVKHLTGEKFSRFRIYRLMIDTKDLNLVQSFLDNGLLRVSKWQAMTRRAMRLGAHDIEKLLFAHINARLPESDDSTINWDDNSTPDWSDDSSSENSLT